jgi:cell wall-associated NlpC family hydrolase
MRPQQQPPPAVRRINSRAWLVAIVLLVFHAQVIDLLGRFAEAADLGAIGSIAGTSVHRPARRGRGHPSARAGAAIAVAYARSQLGKPYQWGAEGPGAFDCSGLTWAAWRAAGLGWDRMTAAGQWEAFRGREVARSALRPGDLVFFAYRLGDWRSIHHVGLYVGGGRMVEAPRTGADIRLASINRAGYIGAARPETLR